MPQSNTPPPSRDQGVPFSSLPQKYPKAQRAAAQVASHIHEMMKRGPRSLLATVIDTSYHATMGYVSATTQLGVVQVHGVPYGSVVPQMRIFVRQIGPHSTTRQFLFDGYAPALSRRGLASQSLCYIQPSGLASTQALLSTSSVPTTASLTSGIVGYYWHLFFYLPQVPATRVTIFQMSVTAGGPNLLTLEYLPNGYMLFRSAENNHGYTTTRTVPAHQMHWVVLQPGLGGSGSGREWYIDGQSYAAGINSSSDEPYFNGNGATYTVSYLSNTDGSQLCPLGSWIAKFGYGSNAPSGTPQQLLNSDTGLALATSTPTDESAYPNQALSNFQRTWLLYTTGTASSSTTSLANQAFSFGGLVVSISTPYAQLVAPGPY